MPTLADAAFYVAVLAISAAAVAISAAVHLWLRVTLLARTVAGLAAGTILLGEAVQLSLGLPGAAGLGRLGVVETALAVGLAALVLVLLLVDAAHRRPEPAPDQPYAL